MVKNMTAYVECGLLLAGADGRKLMREAFDFGQGFCVYRIDLSKYPLDQETCLLHKKTTAGILPQWF